MQNASLTSLAVLGLGQKIRRELRRFHFLRSRRHVDAERFGGNVAVYSGGLERELGPLRRLWNLDLDLFRNLELSAFFTMGILRNEQRCFELGFPPNLHASRRSGLGIEPEHAMK